MVLWRTAAFVVDISTAASCRVTLGFVLDASGTTRMLFNQQKFVLLEVARGFILQPLGTQAAVARYVTIISSVTMLAEMGGVGVGDPEGEGEGGQEGCK